MYKKILLFGGTSEGRKLAEEICARGVPVHVFVATKYGQALIPQGENITSTAQRLTEEEMEHLLSQEKYSCVVDATHPFAVLVSKNLQEACQKTEISYFRLLREKSQPLSLDLVRVENTGEAAKFLKETTGAVLLTTGTKELDQFTIIPNYATRLYPRVLPTTDAILRCNELGFSGKNIIAMQGPFSTEMNTALFRQLNIAWLVTKESGRAGGLPEKLDAACAIGIGVVLIGCPPQSSGWSYDSLLEMMQSKEIIPPDRTKNCTNESLEKSPSIEYFPLFVSLKNQVVQVFGGGVVSSRRVQTLLPFGCKIQVCAPRVLPELKALAQQGKICLQEDIWNPGSCKGNFVLAATDNRRVNQQISIECKEKQIPVNIADCPEECDFYFPAIVSEDGLTLGICSGGKDHYKVSKTAASLRELLSQNKNQY